MFKVTILKYNEKYVTLLFDNKKENVIGFRLDIPIINKSFFLNKTIPELIKEKTGLVVKSESIEFKFNKGEDDFDNFIKRNTKKYLNNKIRFIGYSYSLDKHISNAIYDNYDVFVIVEYENDKENNHRFDIGSIDVKKGTNVKDIEYKTDLSTLISTVARYGNLIIDDYVLSAVEDV